MSPEQLHAIAKLLGTVEGVEAIMSEGIMPCEKVIETLHEDANKVRALVGMEQRERPKSE